MRPPAAANRSPRNGRSVLRAGLLLAGIVRAVVIGGVMAASIALAQSGADSTGISAPMIPSGSESAEPMTTGLPPVPENASPSASPTSSQTAISKQPISPSPFGILKPEDGTFIPLPPQASYQDFLEWIAAQRGPGYGINSVEIRGAVTEKSKPLIELEVVVTIVVQWDEEWVRVPLGFKDAVQAEPAEHEGPGSVSYAGYSNKTGHTWMLSGRGTHELTLSLLAPFKEVRGESQFTLSTPEKSATTLLQLSFSEDAEISAQGGVLRQTHPAEQTTTATWVGPGGEVALSWHPRPETARPEDLTVRTEMTVSFSKEECLIEARQRIVPASGRIAGTSIQLPEGFTFSGVSGDYVEPESVRRSSKDHTVSVALNEPRSEPVELVWHARASLAEHPRLTISDFQVPRVPEAAQSGQIQFAPSRAYRKEDLEMRGLSTGAPETEASDSIESVSPSIYQFAKQPYALTFAVEAIPPKFQTRPRFLVSVHPERLDLDAKFDVNVLAGELQQMRLRWRAEDWTISKIRSGSIQELDRANDQSPPITLQVPNRISFELPVFATLRRQTLAGRFTVSLPQLDTTDPLATATREKPILAVRFPTNLRVSLSDRKGDPLPKADGSSALRLPDPSDDEQINVYRVPTNVTAVVFEIERLQQQITTETTIQVRPRGESLMVTQWFHYDIQYGPLSELHLRIPRALFERGLEFTDGSGRALPLESTEAPGGMVDAVLHLERSVIGQLAVSTHYDVAPNIERGDSGQLSLPVIDPVDGEFLAAQLSVAPLPYHDMAIASETWQPVNKADAQADRSIWQAGALPQAIPITLTRKPPETVTPPTIEKMLLRSTVLREGEIHTVVDCRLAHPPAVVQLTVPPGADPNWFRWRGIPLEPEEIRQGETTLVTLTLAEGAGPSVLSFEYDRSSTNPPGFFDWNQIRTLTFDEDIVIGEVVWRLSLPESAHLFSNSSSYRPRFAWGLDSGFWSRETVPSFQDLEAWFGAAITDMGPEFQNGHDYVFSRTGGSRRPLVFSMVATSMIVLIGAGLAILLGYAFANGFVPRQRYVIPGLVAVFLLALAFFPDQVQIFLQPMLLGLLLVAAALVAERILQRRQERLTAASDPSSEVDFVTILPEERSGSSPSMGIGSEEPTVVRAAGHSPSPSPEYDYEAPRDS